MLEYILKLLTAPPVRAQYLDTLESRLPSSASRAMSLALDEQAVFLSLINGGPNGDAPQLPNRGH